MITYPDIEVHERLYIACRMFDAMDEVNEILGAFECTPPGKVWFAEVRGFIDNEVFNLARDLNEGRITWNI